MKESRFQRDLIEDLHDRLPGCIVFKTDPRYIQGFPDLMCLYKDRWGALECKAHEKASRQPNQDYYIKKLNDMAFAAVVYPENKEEILDAIQHALRPSRSARIPRSEQVSLDKLRRRKAS